MILNLELGFENTKIFGDILGRQRVFFFFFLTLQHPSFGGGQLGMIQLEIMAIQ